MTSSPKWVVNNSPDAEEAAMNVLSINPADKFYFNNDCVQYGDQVFVVHEHPNIPAGRIGLNGISRRCLDLTLGSEISFCPDVVSGDPVALAIFKVNFLFSVFSLSPLVLKKLVTTALTTLLNDRIISATQAIALPAVDRMAGFITVQTVSILSSSLVFMPLGRIINSTMMIIVL